MVLLDQENKENPFGLSVKEIKFKNAKCIYKLLSIYIYIFKLQHKSSKTRTEYIVVIVSSFFLLN